MAYRGTYRGNTNYYLRMSMATERLIKCPRCSQSGTSGHSSSSSDSISKYTHPQPRAAFPVSTRIAQYKYRCTWSSTGRISFVIPVSPRFRVYTEKQWIFFIVLQTCRHATATKYVKSNKANTLSYQSRTKYHPHVSCYKIGVCFLSDVVICSFIDTYSTTVFRPAIVSFTPSFSKIRCIDRCILLM